MHPPRCDKRRLALAAIAIVTNSCYSAIAPILPLEIDKHHIPEQYVSFIFLAFAIGSSVAPPLVSRHLESIGTAEVMAYSMAGMSLLFLCLGCIFDVDAALLPSSNDDPTQSSSSSNNHDMIIVGLMTLLQFFMGVFFSVITVGYYSLATLVFVEKESAMSSIEVSVGTGYILGPIFGSMIYDEMGYDVAYACISFAMMVMALVTWKFLAPYLKYKAPTEDAADDNITPTDEEEQKGFVCYNSLDTDILAPGSRVRTNSIGKQSLNINTQTKRAVQQPSTLSLLMSPKILFAATNIMWINVSWTFIEPLLAKRLDNFHVGKKAIGILFSLSSIIYVPSVFLVQYLPRHYMWRHRVISLSTMLTSVAVLLVGSNTFSLVIVGISLLGLLPTPSWIMLLPFMQEESAILYPDPDVKRCVNDVTAGVYNSFMTLGQVVGYIIGPLMGSHGFARATHAVALLIFLQSLLFYFCTQGYNQRRKKNSITYCSIKQTI